MRQADDGIERAIGYLAEIYKTLAQTGHAREAGECWFYMKVLDAIRKRHLDWYRKVWAGSERGLWTPESFDDIMAEADTVPDPRES
jgi:hypothetical protein